jgi:peptidoglycan/LPS O-acetylase OafA/YrhL
MLNRNQSLDIARGIAVLLVLLAHYPFADDVMKRGWIGVDLFFVLSGFLISGLLFSEFKKTGRLDVKRFWIRRAFKIYPPFYVLMAATAAFFLLRAGTVPKAIFGDLFFLQNYAPHLWDHGWSLAVEEHFYFALPLLLWIMLRISKYSLRAIPAISIVVSIVCFGLRLYTSQHTTDLDRVAFPTHLRCDGLFAGVALGYYCHFDAQSFSEARRYWTLIVGTAMALCGAFLSLVWAKTFVYVGFAFILSWAANQPRSENPVARTLARLGFYSYSIYLWHGVLVLAFGHLADEWYSLPMYLCCSIAAGVAMAKLIELPALKLREKIVPSLKSEQTTQVPGYWRLTRVA